LPSRLEVLANPSLLPPLSPSQLRQLLAEALVELRASHLEISLVSARQARAKIEGYHRSPATTVGGRERDADGAALELTTVLHELRGQQAALEVEASLYRLYLES
jgi:hypothetical protein